MIGGGPAGLMAAEALSAAGLSVTVYERMPTAGRKLLMAGRGGLNLTHSEPYERFVTRYGAATERLSPVLDGFTPGDLLAWADGLGQPTFVGSSGRVFPKALKASPLLRAWLARLAGQGVTLRTRWDWRGWAEGGDLAFQTPEGAVVVPRPDATILALGGASWPGLGSDGAWAGVLARAGAPLAAFEPANCGVAVDWSPTFRDRFAGQPLKAVALAFGDRRVRGEAMIARYGLEGGAVYALVPALREALANEARATLRIDLRPDMPASDLAKRLARRRPGQSMSDLLRRAVNLSPVETNLLREVHGVVLPSDPAVLAAAIKACPIALTGVQGLARAISTAGGVRLDAVDDDLALAAIPDVFVAGEMLDWEAPTGGYLLQATFATGLAAARGVLRRLT